MPLSIGVNLRVTGHCNQGGRKYMEDMFSVAYQQSSNDRELEYAFFGIFDGHGGGEAATFAKENLMDIIVKQKNFWSDNDEDVLKAIRDGYVNTHYAMWRELDKWPRTASGLPSTAGTTASIAFIRKGKIYIGHVGDSAIILGYQEKGDPDWKSTALTRDHKPECCTEMTRIQESGGKVVSKSGVPRVVWNRPRLGHKGPVRRSTHIDEIPFLAVARSLGDLWSYNSELNTFVVSPEPDVKVIKIDVKSHRCLIFGTDGLWNMLTPQAAVSIVQAAEKHNEKHLIASQQTGSGQGETQMWINPSKSLVDRALDRWSSTRLRADNTSVVTLMLDPPGPTHSEILLSQKREQITPIQPTQPTSEPVYRPVVRPIFKPQPIISERTNCPCSSIPKTSLAANLDIQKYPDSSNHVVSETTTVPPSENSSSNDKFVASPTKEMPAPNQNSANAVPHEESIQVAEISSSNVADIEQNSSTSTDESIIETDHKLIVESSNVPEIEESSTTANKISDLDTVETETTKFLLERDSWLQQVPEAEQFQSTDADNTDLMAIKCSDPPQGPKLRRNVHETTTTNSNNALTKRVSTSSGYVIRQTNRRRRHSTGAPQNGQRQPQRQRRSLTPKSVTTNAAYMSNSTKNLKRSSKVLIENELEAPRVGVGTKNTDCNYEAKDTANREPCLKRRTRSEDLRNTQDENDPVNQKVEQQQQSSHSRLRWSVADASISRTSGVLNSTTNGIQERRLSSPNSFKRRNLEKKVTSVKTIRRPSINRSTNRIQMRESFWDQGRASRTGASCASNRRQTVMGLLMSTESMSSTSTSSSSSSSSTAPKRWLRSDTIAATPIKTLRSRNVDIGGHTVSAQVANQYGTVKPNRILETPSKLNKSMTVTTESTLSTPSTTPNAAMAKVKSTTCTTTPSTATPNRTKQSCSITTPSSSASTSSSSSSSSSASITKRTKTPYNPSARSLSTRTRIKRLSK